MKYYLVRNNNGVDIVGAFGFVPRDFVAEAPLMPNGAVCTDGSLISERSGINEHGEPITEYFVDPIKVLAKEANALAEEKQRAIVELHAEMNKEVLSQMFNTFGTTNPDSANANKQTWEIMKTRPAVFRSIGLTAERQILASDNMTVLFEKGAQLNTDEAVVGYATRLLEMTEAYGVYRMRRIQQFREEKELVLNS